MKRLRSRDSVRLGMGLATRRARWAGAPSPLTGSGNAGTSQGIGGGSRPLHHDYNAGITTMPCRGQLRPELEATLVRTPVKAQERSFLTEFVKSADAVRTSIGRTIYCLGQDHGESMVAKLKADDAARVAPTVAGRFVEHTGKYAQRSAIVASTTYGLVTNPLETLRAMKNDATSDFHELGEMVSDLMYANEMTEEQTLRVGTRAMQLWAENADPLGPLRATMSAIRTTANAPTNAPRIVKAGTKKVANALETAAVSATASVGFSLFLRTLINQFIQPSSPMIARGLRCNNAAVAVVGVSQGLRELLRAKTESREAGYAMQALREARLETEAPPLRATAAKDE